MATSTANLKLSKINSSDYVSVDTFNENYDILDNLGVDYIIEKGTSDEWYYRKWNSGLVECWYKKVGTTSTDVDYYNVKKALPFTLTSNQHIQASGGVTGKVNTNIRYAALANTYIDVYINFPNPSPNLNWWIDVYVVGNI